eukprot:SAG11_NODE_10626_length_816_cov_0.995816_1_plen_146_part_10
MADDDSGGESSVASAWLRHISGDVPASPTRSAPATPKRSALSQSRPRTTAASGTPLTNRHGRHKADHTPRTLASLVDELAAAMLVRIAEHAPIPALQLERGKDAREQLPGDIAWLERAAKLGDVRSAAAPKTATAATRSTGSASIR